MRQRTSALLLFLLFTVGGIERSIAQQNSVKQDETIFVWGGEINTKFVQYVADLTKKRKPKNLLLTNRKWRSSGQYCKLEEQL